MVFYTVGAWWMLVAWIGHVAVYSLIEKKEGDLGSSAPETAKGLGRRVVGRSGGKGTKGKRWGAFPLFPATTGNDFKSGISSEKTCWSQKTLIQSRSLFRASQAAYQLGLVIWQLPVWITPGKTCCHRAHLPGWGGKATALLYSASGFWAAGIPSHHAVYLPNFKGQGSHQREEENRDEINSLPPSQPPCSIRNPPLPKC